MNYNIVFIEAIESGKNINKIYIQIGLHRVNYKRLQEKNKKYRIPFRIVPKQ